MMNNKIIIRNSLRIAGLLLFGWLYLPHVLLYFSNAGGGKRLIHSDLMTINNEIGFNLPVWIQLKYQLHYNRYYRNLFYHRIGPVFSLFLSWYRPEDRYFMVGKDVEIGKSMWISHPYSTVLWATSIGDNFRCIHCVTLGAKASGRPIIGNNVSIGAGACVLGNVKVGNNVIIGAGAIVVKDVPDNCVVVGNPARIVKELQPLNSNE